jgi:uncharacterized protein YggE
VAEINKKIMKKVIVVVILLVSSMLEAQDSKSIQTPQISVSGEGKIKVTPDMGVVSLGVENTGKDAAEVKKLNDDIIDKVIKYIKKNGIQASDFQTTNVSLYKNYDYEKKKYNFVANQTITVTLKDLKKYNEFMMGISDTGVTTIHGVEFKSSKLTEYESDARKSAMLNAKKKAEDYVSVLNQKVGKAVLISDNSSVYYPPAPMFKGVAMAMDREAGGMPRETLAVGEIEISATVQVSFVLE